MRAQDETRKTALRLVLAAIQNASIPPEPAEGDTTERQRVELDDDAVLEILKREVKMRRDSIDAYTKANRPDLVAKEEEQLAVITPYLPQQMSRDEIAVVAKGVIERVGAKGPAEKGKVMGPLMAELRDKADGRDINAVVTELLAQSS
jgi:uncharacterized protein